MMMNDPIRPLGVTADRQQRTMTVQWSDGHTSLYPFSLLRDGCPCAECRGGHANMSAEPPRQIFSLPDVDTPATRMQSLEGVGNYALTIGWEDGHHFGIYQWDYLRRLCPCPECRAKAALDG
jgi:DUF971 family protein